MTPDMSKWLTVRRLLGLGIALLAGALAIVVAHNIRAGAPEKVVSGLPSNIDLALKKINYTETRNGVKQWTLKADSAAHVANDGTTRVENIHMVFYAQGELGDVILTARRGQLLTNPKEVRVAGDVVVTSSKGYTLYTQHLHFDQTTNMIETDDPVRLVSERMVVNGKGMKMNVRQHQLTLSADVDATIAGEQDGGKTK